MGTPMRIQDSYDIARVRERASKINVSPFDPGWAELRAAAVR